MQYSILKAHHFQFQVCGLVLANASNNPENISNICTCHTVQTLHGGPTMNMLGRSHLYSHPGHPEKLLVCAGDEATVSVCTQYMYSF
jgi:hypothetical protein